MTTEVIAERGDFRAVIQQDENPYEPEHDGGAPIIRLEFYAYWRAEQVNYGQYVVPESVLIAAQHYGTNHEMLARYLRVFHGARFVNVGDIWGVRYITYDPEDWRKEWQITSHEDPTDLTEWMAYVDGDVWGVAVQRLYDVETIVRVKGMEVSRTSTQEWRTIGDSACWGYYGYKNAEDEAKEALSTWFEE